MTNLPVPRPLCAACGNWAWARRSGNGLSLSTHIGSPCGADRGGGSGKADGAGRGSGQSAAFASFGLRLNPTPVSAQAPWRAHSRGRHETPFSCGTRRDDERHECDARFGRRQLAAFLWPTEPTLVPGSPVHLPVAARILAAASPAVAEYILGSLRIGAPWIGRRRKAPPSPAAI